MNTCQMTTMMQNKNNSTPSNPISCCFIVSATTHTSLIWTDLAVPITAWATASLSLQIIGRKGFAKFYLKSCSWKVLMKLWVEARGKSCGLVWRHYMAQTPKYWSWSCTKLLLYCNDYEVYHHINEDHYSSVLWCASMASATLAKYQPACNGGTNILQGARWKLSKSICLLLRLENNL